MKKLVIMFFLLCIGIILCTYKYMDNNRAAIQKNNMQTTNKEIVYDNIKEDENVDTIENTHYCSDIFIGSLDFDENDSLMLHKIAVAEAGGEGVESMALIMLVVLNRTWDLDFPDTIEDVIYEEGQFTPISDGRYYDSEPNEKSQEAMELILSGWNESQGALYFESCKGDSWHSRNLELLFEKDNIRFYK